MATIRTKTKTGMLVFLIIWLPLLFFILSSGNNYSSFEWIFFQVIIIIVAYVPAYIIDYLRFKYKIRNKINYNNLNYEEKKIIDELISNKFDE